MRKWYAVLVALGAVLALAVRAAAEETGLFDVPRLAGIVIDGKADDWHDAGFKVKVMTAVDGWIRSAPDMDCCFSLGWDKRGLLVLIQVNDQSFVEAEKIDALYEGDSVELYLADKRGGTQMIQAVISPGMTLEQPELRQRSYDYRASTELKATPPAVQAARTKTPGGYVMEVLLPWTNIGIAPAVGGEVGFQVFANDRDLGEPLFNTVWYPATGTFQHSDRTYRIRLAERPSPPFLAVARGFARGGDAWFSVVAAPELAGKGVAARFDGKQIAAGKLAAFDGRALACVHAKLPEGVTEDSTFAVAVGEQAVGVVRLLDLENERGEHKLPLRYVFRPFVFSGERLPPGGFEAVAAMERLLGPHEIKVTYYDATFNAVTTASKPGRYGAVVEVAPRFHPPLRRCYTLFRSDKPVDWRRAAMRVEAELPKELGLDPVVVREQGEFMGEFLRNAVAESLARRDDGAAMLAWLHDTPPGTRTTLRNSPWSANSRWMHELRRHAGILEPLKYWVELPAGVKNDPARKWPTIVYLHGSGDKGAPVAALAYTGAVRMPRELKPETFIVIAPRCPANSGWSQPALEDVLKDVSAKYPIDENRLYLTGLSSGGFASWALTAECPERFAAVVPLCGGGDPREAERFKDLPLWAFHGAKDDAVPVERSREMVAALHKLGGRVRYVEYPDLGHNCWSATYAMPELYDWLLKQVRGKPDQPPADPTSPVVVIRLGVGWEKLAPLAVPRHDLQLIAIGGGLLAISGAHDETVADVDRYDPARNAWASRAPIPEKRGWFGAAVIGGKVYCVGGKRVRTAEEQRAGGDDRHYEYRASLNVYDPAADRWTVGPPLRAARAGCAAAALAGKLYVIAGSEPGNGFLDRVEVYDPATNAWQDGPAIPEGREDLGAAAVDGKLYAIGGVKHAVRGDVFVFDPATGRWTSAAPMPTPRRSFALAVDGPRLWCLGGVPATGGYTNVVEVYDTRTNQWAAGPPLPQAKAWLGAAVLDGRLYTVGGANQDAASKRYIWLGEVHALPLAAR